MLIDLIFGRLSFQVGALLTIWAQNVWFLYISRFLCGLGNGGLVVSIPTLINEISFDKYVEIFFSVKLFQHLKCLLKFSVRGALNSLFDPSYNSGTIISFFLGNYLSGLDQAKTQLIGPVIFTIAMFLFPETAEFYGKRNEEEVSCAFIVNLLFC